MIALIAKQRDDKPRDDKPRDDKPRDDKPRDDKPRDDKPRDDKPRDDKPRDDKPRCSSSSPEQQREPAVRIVVSERVVRGWILGIQFRARGVQRGQDVHERAVGAVVIVGTR
jgi:hypothetical protein